MPAITVADLNNAKLDVDHIAAIATSTAPTSTDREGHVKPTLAAVLADLNAQAVVTETGVNRAAAEAAAAIAATGAKFFDTIAVGRAGVADTQTFGVRAGGSDGLLRPTVYRRDSSSTQTKLYEVVNEERIADIARDVGNRRERQNLYDPDRRVDGYYINSTDGVSTAGAAFHTDYIPVTPGGSFTLYPAIPGVIAPAGLAFYDRDHIYVSGIGGPFTAGQVVAVPAQAWFVRVPAAVAQTNTLVILEGSQTPVDVQFHAPAFMSDVWQWHGRQLAVLGDSLSDPDMNATFGRPVEWISAVAATVGASVGLNPSVSGRQMVHALKTRLGADLTSADFTNIDLTFLFIGTNDYGTAATPIGTINDSTATATFYGYTKKAIEQLLTWKPGMRIVIATLAPRFDMTAANSAGKTLADYSAALRAVAERYSLPVWDLERLCGHNTLNSGTFTVDGLHFNGAGDKACIQGPALGFMRTVWPNT